MLGCDIFQLLSARAGIDWPKSISVAKDVAQTLALLIGGAWTYLLFVRHRLHAERADLTHDVTCYELSEKYRLVRVIVAIKNVGPVVIRPPRLTTELYRLLPADIDSMERLEKGECPFAAGTPTSNWPQLGKCLVDLKTEQVTLEPGETEKYAFDFIVPASVRALQVHSQLSCGNAAAEYWDETTTHALSHCDA